MSLRIRRVVTGHDRNGRAIVTTDEITSNTLSRRSGHSSCVIWSTGTFPADNMTAEDGAERAVGSTDPQGSVFRIVEYQPGVARRFHRTLSIDYAVVMQGEIFLELDDTEVRLCAGDVLVQRGTIHSWINRGDEPCVIAFVLTAAAAVVVDGRKLRATG